MSQNGKFLKLYTGPENESLPWKTLVLCALWLIEWKPRVSEFEIVICCTFCRPAKIGDFSRLPLRLEMGNFQNSTAVQKIRVCPKKHFSCVL